MKAVRWIVLCCPNCGKDVPSRDLSRFVRYYHRDEGFEQCPACKSRIHWQMRLWTQRRSVESVDQVSRSVE